MNQEITLSTGQTAFVQFDQSDTLTITADFPSDNEHYITFLNVLNQEVVLTAQQGSTAWRVGTTMPIPGGQSPNNPFLSYNPGVYVWSANIPTCSLYLSVLGPAGTSEST